MQEFQIHEPRSVQEASALLAQYGWESTLYAGGTELLLLMREGLTHFPHLINVKNIAGLDGIRLDDSGEALRIGAAATHHALERSGLIAAYAPLLAEVEALVGNIRVRVTGTIGGNLCFAEPRSDLAALFSAWPGASYELNSTRGSRRVPAADFNTDLFLTVREDDEIMTAIRLPVLASDVGYAYEKFAFLERPSANVAAFLTLNQGQIRAARVVVGSVGPAPFAAVQAAEILRGQRAAPALFEAAADAAAAAADPVDDIYGTAEYKRQLVRVLARRALHRAATRAKGDGS
ncbi:MAG: FAD binding domain-containing protein [Candidatus Promineifilaceae bacterium]|nr:FAD binding domain-containing protein [Candidatus Promineifilaceae bacterium]